MNGLVRPAPCFRDGRGFDPAATPTGTGVQGMPDRLAALGGTVEIVSAPGRGTKITGRIPVAAGQGRPGSVQDLSALVTEQS